VALSVPLRAKERHGCKPSQGGRHHSPRRRSVYQTRAIHRSQAGFEAGDAADIASYAFINLLGPAFRSSLTRMPRRVP
jgi:hypothetical protein